MQLSVVPYVLPANTVAFEVGYPDMPPRKVVNAGTEVYRIEYQSEALGKLYFCYQYVHRAFVDRVIENLMRHGLRDGNDLLANWRRWDDHARFYVSARED